MDCLQLFLFLLGEKIVLSYNQLNKINFPAEDHCRLQKSFRGHGHGE